VEQVKEEAVVAVIAPEPVVEVAEAPVQETEAKPETKAVGKV